MNEALLNEVFLQHPYYAPDRQLPIGVGPDDFPETLFHEWVAEAEKRNVRGKDLLATLTELTARQLALACKKYGGAGVLGTDDVLVRGGVCNNEYFMERLAANLEVELGLAPGKLPVRPSEGAGGLKTLDSVGIDEDSWENAMYALFGFLCVNNMTNFAPSCTGARYSAVGGKIAPGANFGRLFRMNMYGGDEEMRAPTLTQDWWG